VINKPDSPLRHGFSLGYLLTANPSLLSLSSTLVFEFLHPHLQHHKINWSFFDDAFKKHYSEKMGKPAKPIRLMVSLQILKYVRYLSDENLVEPWAENIYFQYFSGEQHFQANLPCVAY